MVPISSCPAEILRRGLEKSLNLRTFRFNLSYDELAFEGFLCDLLNSMEVRSQLGFLPFSWETGAGVKAKKLRASLTNLDIFDKLETNGQFLECLSGKTDSFF